MFFHTAGCQSSIADPDMRMGVFPSALTYCFHYVALDYQVSNLLVSGVPVAHWSTCPLALCSLYFLNDTIWQRWELEAIHSNSICENSYFGVN